MKLKPKEVIKEVHPSKVILPILIGVGVAAYIIYKEDPFSSIAIIEFTRIVAWFLFLALLMTIIRVAGYAYRLRIISEKKLSVLQAVRITFLWEFASAVTPSSVGGTSVALLFLYKEGLSIGKSTAIVLATLFLDELYFIIIFPLIVLFGGWERLFEMSAGDGLSIFQNKYFYIAMAGFGVKIALVSVVGYGLFVNPHALKRVIVGIFSLPGLRRWKQGAIDSGDDIVLASEELAHKPLKFWIRNFVATFFSWTSRYWVVNFLILALIFGINGKMEHHLLSISDHFTIFARQLIMWIMMIIMPTPGGTGLTEVIFLEYMDLFIPKGFTSLMTVIWRLFSYYPFLLIGAVLLPVWIRKSFSQHHHEEIIDHERDLHEGESNPS